MPHTKSPHDLAPWLRPLGYAAAASIVALAIVWSWQSPAAITAPFGWPRLAVVHVLCALPCAALAAGALRRKVPQALCVPVAIATVALSLAGLAALPILMPVVGSALAAHDAGYAMRLFARVAICLALELFWCLAVELLLASRMALSQREHSSSLPQKAYWAGLAAAVAILLPAVYGLELSRRQTAQAGELIERQQIVAAAAIAGRLAAIGSPRTISGAPPRVAQAHLRKKITELERFAAVTASGTDRGENRLERARALAMLGRAAEAQACVAPLAERNPDAALLLAAILQELQQWDESTRWYRAGMRLAVEELPPAEATSRRVRAINGLAFNARSAGQYAEAEAAYLAGLAEIPAAAAHFHYQLGRHHQMGGRPARAAEHLRSAAQLAPQQYAEPAAAMLKQLASETPACLLGSGASLRRDPGFVPSH